MRSPGEVVLSRGPIPNEISGFRFSTGPYQEPTIALFDGALPGDALAIVVRDRRAVFPRMIVLSTDSSREAFAAATAVLRVDQGMFDVLARRVLCMDRFGCVRTFGSNEVVWEVELRQEVARLENNWRFYRIERDFNVPEVGLVRVLRRRRRFWYWLSLQK